MRQARQRFVLSTCPFCGCGCGLYLEPENGMIVGSYPSRNHPVSKGALCVKGWNAYEFVNKLDRLTAPLIKSNGRFEEVSWDEARETVYKRLLEIKDKYGPDALGFLSSAKATNEENFLMMKLARAVFKTNNIDHCARLCHASTVVGLAATFGSGAMTNSINEFEEHSSFTKCNFKSKDRLKTLFFPIHFYKANLPDTITCRENRMFMQDRGKPTSDSYIFEKTL